MSPWANTPIVWVEDDAGNLAQTALRVFVNDLHLAEVPLLSGFAGIAKVLHTITADGVIPGEQYMIVAGNTQGYFAVDADRGGFVIAKHRLGGGLYLVGGSVRWFVFIPQSNGGGYGGNKRSADFCLGRE